MPFVDPAAVIGAEDAVMAVFRRVRDEIMQKFLDYYEAEIGRWGA